MAKKKKKLPTAAKGVFAAFALIGHEYELTNTERKLITRSAEVANGLLDATTNPVENTFKVPKKQWGKWKGEAPRVAFNRLYGFMIDNPDLFDHPKAPVKPQDMESEHWKTVAWNAAWIAADIVQNDLILLPEFGYRVPGARRRA